MRRLIIAIFILSATAGCRRTDQTTKPPTPADKRIGIVDLNQVAQDLGWHDDMVKKLTDLGDSFSTQIKQINNAYGAQMKKARASFLSQPDGKLTAAQQQTLDTMFDTAQRIVTDMQSDANAETAEYREDCLTAYRAAIQPIVRDVAKSHNVTVVLTPTDMVLYHDSAVDLTAEVSAAAQAHPPDVTPMTLPTLPPAPPLANPDVPATGPATAQ
jgi:Skp family chaperone for outer membrane proteins